MARPWRAAILLSAVLAGVCASMPRRCAGDPVTTTAPTISFDGFFSASYSYNFNRPASGTNQFRVFDVDDNTYKLDVIELVMQKPVARPREAGVRVDLTVGGSIPRVTAASGLFRDASGQAEDIDLQQAFASWIAPAGSGLRLDLGKFVTHFGSEVIQGYDGWNDEATRSFLFGYAIPFTHVGVRASYTASPKVNLMAMVVNGWDVARDNNRSKSVGGQIVVMPAGTLALTLNAMWGPERSDNDADARTMLDAVATLKLGERATIGINGDWGTDANAAGAGADARWSGVAGYLRVTVTPSFALSARGEMFDDRDGARTGTAQTLREVTVTPELRLTPHLLLRADARLDHSDLPVFEKRVGLANTQPSILLDVVGTF